jgi:hypothetical protein
LLQFPAFLDGQGSKKAGHRGAQSVDDFSRFLPLPRGLRSPICFGHVLVGLEDFELGFDQAGSGFG